MKRLIAAGIIIALVFATSFIGINVITTTADEVEMKIKEIQENTFGDTGKKAEKFFYYWENKRELLAVFVNHNEIDEIGRLAAKMVSAERDENSEDLFEAANEILFIIRSIKEDEYFSLYTLL